MLDQPQRQRQAPDLETNMHRISCVMTCAGVTSNRRRLILCRQAKPSAPRKNPSAADLRPRRTEATNSTRSTTRIRKTQRPTTTSGRSTGSTSGARPLALTWRSKFCCAGVMTSISRMPPTRAHPRSDVARANSACEFYALCVLRLSPTHCQRPSKREHGEE